MHESELIIHYTLDHAGIMIVTDLIRDMPEMDVISTLTYLENATMQQWWFGSVTTFYKQSDHTNIYNTFRTVLCHCSFPKKGKNLGQ